MIPAYPGPFFLDLGIVQLPVFGMLVATGVLLGHEVVLRLAARRGVPAGEIRAAAACAVLAGFVGAHLLEVFLYRPDKLARDGLWALVRIQDGISSYGGFGGALVGVWVYFWRLGRTWWEHADCLVEGLAVGWLFGRLGCTLTSDHLGRPSEFLLAFVYPSGPRHNVGFYEFVYTALVLLPAVWLLERRRARGDRVPAGMSVVVVAGLYAPARFLLDFLRAVDIENADPRYLGLTGAQYFSAALLAFALWKWSGLRRSAT